MANDTQNSSKKVDHPCFTWHPRPHLFLGLGLTTLGFVWLGWLFLPVPLLWVSQHPCIGGHWLHAPRMRQEAEDGGLNSFIDKNSFAPGKSTWSY